MMDIIFHGGFETVSTRRHKITFSDTFRISDMLYT